MKKIINHAVSAFVVLSASHLLVGCFGYDLTFRPTADVTLAPQPAPSEALAVSQYYPDIAYGNHEQHRFDLYLPAVDEVTPEEGGDGAADNSAKVPLIIFIHGGGFVQGDKADVYDRAGLTERIKQTLAHGMGFASINYRLLGPLDPVGVDKAFMDSKAALQFICYGCRCVGH